MARKVITGTAIAADARRYTGKGYTYGGDCSGGPGDWDCSSFVSYVLGHDLRLPLPGGRYGEPGFPPNAHGPVVTSYARWTGAVTVHAPQAGDLCCFVGEGPNGHIGIAVSGTHMVSALNTQTGTVLTPIQGFGPPGAPLIYRRVSGTVTAAVARAAGIKTRPGAAEILEELAGAALVAGGVVVVVWAAWIVAPVAMGWAFRKAIKGAVGR